MRNPSISEPRLQKLLRVHRALEGRLGVPLPQQMIAGRAEERPQLTLTLHGRERAKTLEGMPRDGVEERDSSFVRNLEGQLRHVRPGERAGCLAHRETMSFDLGLSASWVDLVDLQDEMIESAEIPRGSADEIEEGAGPAAGESPQWLDIEAVPLLCQAKEMQVVLRKSSERLERHRGHRFAFGGLRPRKPSRGCAAQTPTFDAGLTRSRRGALHTGSLTGVAVLRSSLDAFEASSPRTVTDPWALVSCSLGVLPPVATGRIGRATLG